MIFYSRICIFSSTRCHNLCLFCTCSKCSSSGRSYHNFKCMYKGKRSECKKSSINIDFLFSAIIFLDQTPTLSVSNHIDFRNNQRGFYVVGTKKLGVQNNRWMSISSEQFTWLRSQKPAKCCLCIEPGPTHHCSSYHRLYYYNIFHLPDLATCSEKATLPGPGEPNPLYLMYPGSANDSVIMT